MEGLSRPLHVFSPSRPRSSPARSGRDRRPPQGHRRGPRGDHDDHAQLDRHLRHVLLYEIGGPLQGPQESIPRSDEVFESAELWPIWGSLPSLHAGIFIALFALVVYAVILNRTTLGFEVRAVGFNPEARATAASRWRRTTSWRWRSRGARRSRRIDRPPRVQVQRRRATTATNFIAFTGIAVALLGRTRPSASSSQPSSSPRSRSAPRPPARSGSSSRARGRPRDDDPGARDLLRRRRGSSAIIWQARTLLRRGAPAQPEATS